MKKNIKLSSVILTTALLFTTVTSCKKDYFDINENPNFPVNAGIIELLPSAEAAIAQAIGNPLQISGGLYAQYWTQNTSNSQYKTFEQYLPSADDFDRPWGILYYDALNDLDRIIKKATAENKPHYIQIAKILQAYAYQVLTDNFGDVPYSEALKGDVGVLSPKYDSQEAVYNGIFTLLTDAINQIDENEVVDEIGTADIIYHGDMYLWKKFANTLMLRAALRLSEVAPTTSMEKINFLTGQGALFLDQGEDARIDYFNEGGRSNPLYSSGIDLNQIQNLVASATTINYMLNTADERVAVFYNPTGGNFIGIPQGEYTLPAGTPVSIPSPVVGGDVNDEASATAPVKLMTGYESYFLQAEAIARGWMTGDDQGMYELGITTSYTDYEIPDTLATAYFSQPDVLYPAGGGLSDKIKAIITQKWAAMCGTQNNEAWAEARRTNYPDFFTVSANSLIGARFPARLFYPSTELTRNANFPGQKNIWEPVWWDAN
jgi:hypothetical protein